jgi:hypothetical protein
VYFVFGYYYPFDDGHPLSCTWLVPLASATKVEWTLQTRSTMTGSEIGFATVCLFARLLCPLENATKREDDDDSPKKTDRSGARLTFAFDTSFYIFI